MKKLFVSLAFVLSALSAVSAAHAEEIAILFSGRTHAMIYPCNCPLEPAGGISRRASAVKNFAARKIPFVLLDAGDSFAGGVMDQYSKGDELDKERTRVNLKALSLMGYDCVALGDSEVGFGGDFFKKIAAASGVPFISCTIKAEEVKPFMVKKAGSALIGVTAVSSEAVQKKIPGSVFVPAEQALRETVAALRQQGCSVVAVISNVSEKDSFALVREIPGIDLLILNKPADNKEKDEEAPGNVIVLKSFWQGRRLGKALITFSAGKIEKLQFSEETLTEKIPEDKDIGKILPRCFSDANCLRAGQAGMCEKPGTMAAQCSFAPAPKVKLLVIAAKDCLTCDTESTVTGLQGGIPGLSVETISYPGAKAEEYMRKFGIKALPAYLLGKEIENEKVFNAMKTTLEPLEGFYRIKAEATGFGYFPERPRIEGRVDLFLSLFGKDSRKLLENMQEFSPVIHFLVKQENGEFSVKHGANELEEDLRSVCVRKYYPGLFYGYLTCRSQSPESSWWDKCLTGVDPAPVRDCALGGEGTELLGQDIALGKELNIENGPTYLYENREIFSSNNVPSKEELRKILIRK